MENEDSIDQQDESQKLIVDKKETVEKNGITDTAIGQIRTEISTTVDDNGAPITYAQFGYSKKFKDMELEGNLANNNGKVEYNSSVNFNASNDIANGNIKVENNNGNIEYQIDGSASIDLGKGYSGNTEVHADSQDSYLKLGMKKELFNPDNPMNINNHDKIRKEELVETGERFSLESKIGYSNEQNGLYTNNSLMYRINNNNFLKAAYNQNSLSKDLNLSADLKSVKIDYGNTKQKEENVEVTGNTIDVMTKGKRNQYTVGLNTTSTKEEDNNTRKYGIRTEAQFNRTEDGEFQSGLNGAVKGKVNWTDNKVSDYSLSFEGAFNKYGNENDSDKDYLVRGKLSFGQEDNTKNFSASIDGAYRINNCRTIFEPRINYDSTSSLEGSNKTLSGRFDVFQQVGKNFGDATVFAQAEVGKSWENTPEQRFSTTFAQLRVGSEIRATKRLALDFSTTYDTRYKLSGEATMRYTF